MRYMRNDLIVVKMIELIDRLQKFVGESDYETFCENGMLVDACVFNLSQLGEQANKIDEEFEEMHPDISWREIYGLRNRIVHDYEGVNLKLIWQIISEDLPELKEALEKI